MQLIRSDPSRQIWLAESELPESGLSRSEQDLPGRPIRPSPDLDAAGSLAVGTPRGEPVDVGAVVVDPGRVCQPVAGFGAALTDSAVAVLSGMRPSRRARLLTELFGAERMGLGAVRITLGPSDYSPSFYTRTSAEAEQLTRPRLELLHQIREIRPDLLLYASSWSPPPELKSNGSLLGGSFRSECSEALAEQLFDEIAAYAEHGFEVDYVSVQNEPGHASEQYPSCWMSTADQAAVARQLRTRLDVAGSAAVLLAHDHNWDLADRAERALAQADGAFGGIAWHGYSDPAGVAAQSRLQAAQRQGLEVHFTEVCELDTSTAAASFAWHQQHLMTEVMQHQSRSVLFWNLALDERGGPAACRQPHVLPLVTVDSGTGAVTRHAGSYALAHTSSQVKRGDHRMHSSVVARGQGRTGPLGAELRRTAPTRTGPTRTGPTRTGPTGTGPVRGELPRLAQVAYLRSDGCRVVVLANTSDQPIRTAVVEDDRWLPVELAAGAAVTMRYR